MNRIGCLGLALTSLIVLAAAGRARAPEGGVAGTPTIDPRGVYLNSFADGAKTFGTMWWQVIPLPDKADHYRLASIFGVGFNGIISPDGVITLDNKAGTGQFTDADEFLLDGGASSNALQPRTFTDPEFPLLVPITEFGNPLLSDAWLAGFEEVDPLTGRALAESVENLTIEVVGDTFRITRDDDGVFYQGVFDTRNNVGFRVVEPKPINPSFQSFVGSATNSGMNMLGEAKILGANQFVATILLESRDPVGAQTQQVLRIGAERADPVNPADLDGDGKVDGVDLGNLLLQWGKCPGTSYCQPDYNGSGIIDGGDLGILLLNWTG